LIGPNEPLSRWRIGQRHFLLFLYYQWEVHVMSFFIGVDVSKEKFDACGIDEQGGKVFSLVCSMDRGGDLRSLS